MTRCKVQSLNRLGDGIDENVPRLGQPNRPNRMECVGKAPSGVGNSTVIASDLKLTINANLMNYENKLVLRSTDCSRHLKAGRRNGSD